jgi:transcriptional regulator with XRE-family HTH domain
MGEGSELWERQVEALGRWMSAQRKLSDLSLRQLSELTEISSTYLSQIERGLHMPSVRVIKSVVEALGLDLEAALAQMGIVKEDAEGEEPGPAEVESAIKADAVLDPQQKEALLTVYRSYVAEHEAE